MLPGMHKNVFDFRMFRQFLTEWGDFHKIGAGTHYTDDFHDVIVSSKILRYSSA
ncbi:hypothetical protein SDC9_120914 [bioreactor metagenome]|uniref:Uncharacterized protein n=1 Tax=bioreactor metagenome TaxID=1076179 RepID=A0A645CAH5_9ZZZZ